MSLIENIIAVYNRAFEHEVIDGLFWYPTANQFAREISHGDIERGVGVIAALSPMMP